MTAVRGRRSGRGRGVWVAVAAVAVYAVVVTLYATSGQLQSDLESAPAPADDGVTVLLTPQSVDAAANRIRVLADVDLGADLTAIDGISPERDLELIVSPVIGSRSIELPAGAALSAAPVEIIVEGTIENWPFDVYVVDPMFIIATQRDDDGLRETIPTNVWVEGGVVGWTLSGGVSVDPAAAGQTAIRIVAVRAASTIAFGVILLGLMVALPCLVLFVAITTFRGRRKVEPTLMSWIAAALFATIPLRTFLPGSPPVGSWVDYLVVLWVVFGLIAGLVIYVTSWYRWGSPPPRPD